jgi:hypothetical protein
MMQQNLRWIVVLASMLLGAGQGHGPHQQGAATLVRGNIGKLRSGQEQVQEKSLLPVSSHHEGTIRHLLRPQTQQSESERARQRKIQENDNNNGESSSVGDTYNDVNETFTTAPADWTKNNGIIAAIVIAVIVVLFGCVYRCIPCAPRII